MLHTGPGGELRGVHPAAGVSGVQAVAEQDKDTGKPEPQLSVLSVSQRWWHICVILLCAQTLGWMAFIRWGIHDSAGSYREIIEAMVYGTSRAIPLFIVFFNDRTADCRIHWRVDSGTRRISEAQIREARREAWQGASEFRLGSLVQAYEGSPRER